MFTRKDYLDEKCSHHEFYSQFVNESILKKVRNLFERSIENSKDEHFNDIPLERWDRCSLLELIDTKIWKLANGRKEEDKHFSWSISDNICIAKAAARIIRDE